MSRQRFIFRRREQRKRVKRRENPLRFSLRPPFSAVKILFETVTRRSSIPLVTDSDASYL
jgi:hypothetical protein